MSRVLFVVLAEKGHVHPFIAPAQELARRGHQVSFYAPCDLRAPLGRAGLREVFVGAEEHAPPDTNRGPAFAALVRDPAACAHRKPRHAARHCAAEVLRLGAVVAELRPT